MTTPAELNRQLAGVLKISRRAMMLLLLVVPGLLVLSLAVNGWLLYQAATENARIRAAVIRVEATACAFNHDLGTAPLPPSATALGVKIIIDSRDRYAGLQCQPPLPSPSPALVRLAAKYHLPLH